MKHFFSMVILLMTCLLQQVHAQDRSISGRVTDRGTGQGLPGVTVLAKGTTNGTSTNSDGNYTISVPASVTKISFSYVGFAPQERDANAATIDVALASDNKVLDEVVVNGLASNIKRSNLANSITTISAQDLYGSTRPVTVDAALNGKVVGANINAVSGAPGGGVQLQLRGVTTLSGNAQPLIVVDGVYAVSQEIGNGAGAAAFTGASGATGRTTQDQGTNRLSDLNPSDIESIEILKGPSAAAIYGSRAAAGVVVIKTKRGAVGQTTVNVSQDVGSQTIQRYIGHSDFDLAKVKLVFPRDPLTPTVPSDNEQLFLDANGKTWDYEKEIFGNKGFMRNTNVSLSGGNDRTRFYAAASTTLENGIVKNTDYQRSSIRLNVDQKVSNRIQLGVNAGYNNSINRRGFFGNDNNGVGVGYNLLSTPSFIDLHPDPVTGIFPESPITGDNPLAIVDKGINRESTNRVTSGANATIKILEKENSFLRVNTQGGIDFASSVANLALPPDLQSQRSAANPGVARVANNQFFNYNLQAFVLYDYKLGPLALTSQVGAIRLGLNTQLQYSQGQRLAPGPLQPDRGTVITQQTTIQDETDVAYVFQQDFNFRDIVVATGGLRADKSSRNGDPKKLYYFPRASASVNLTKISGFEMNNVNLIKLRAAYGEAGNPAFFGATFSPLTNISTGGNGGFQPSTLVGNPNIGPERATELEGGIDMSFFNNRVSLEATAYQKRTVDAILAFPLAPGTGVSSVRAFPVGDIRNRGVELALTLVPVQTANFRWTSTAQYWFNRSLITRLIVPASTNNGFGQSYGITYIAQNESPTQWFGTPAFAPTDDNKIGATRLGDAQPRFQLSSLNSFNIFKDFDVSFLWHWKKDSYNSNLTVSNQDFVGTSPDWSNPITVTANNSAGQPVTVTGPLGAYRGNLNGYGFISAPPASYYVENSGYLRLREVSVYYSLPASVRTSLFKDYVKRLQIGASGNNLVTFTNYKGYDPEVSNFGTTNTGAQVDVVSYPSTKRLWLHLNIGF